MAPSTAVLPESDWDLSREYVGEYADWRYAVTNEDTLRGFRDWLVAERLEIEHKRFVVEIRDEIGYTKDAFDFGDLPVGLQRQIELAPGGEKWTYTDGEGGTWEATPDE